MLDGFGKSVEVILPKLRDGYIVPDPAFARDLALENPDAFFLSQSGECFHNVTVTGGKQRAEGPLEGGIAHARGDHQLRLVRRRGDGERAHRPRGVVLGRLDQREHRVLSGLVGKVGGLVEMEGVGAFRDRLAAAQRNLHANP